MSDYYTVIMISTINSLYGKIAAQERFEQTLEAIESVHRHILGAKIVFVDNSNVPINDEWKHEIEKRVEVFHQVQHNILSYYANMTVARKSESEINMLFEALNVVRKHNLYGKRIFKISGRYRIEDTFDIQEYENPDMIGKFTFAHTTMASSEDNWMTQKITHWFEQALISFCPENMDFLQNQLFGVLAHHRRTGDCIEETMFLYIPHEIVHVIPKAHISGIKAESLGVEKH